MTVTRPKHALAPFISVASGREAGLFFNWLNAGGSLRGLDAPNATVRSGTNICARPPAPRAPAKSTALRYPRPVYRLAAYRLAALPRAS